MMDNHKVNQLEIGSHLAPTYYLLVNLNSNCEVKPV